MNISDPQRESFSIQSDNLPLFRRRPEAWVLALMVDRLEEPLRTLRLRSLESQDFGETRELLFIFCITSSENEHETLLKSSEWFLERVNDLKTCAQDLVFCVNVGLQEALGPPGVESDPAGIEHFCTDILQHLTKLLDMEKDILSRRLHPDVQEMQYSFAGVTADAVASHQKFVVQMRHFLEKENGQTFQSTIKINFNRLETIPKAAPTPSPTPPSPAPAPPKKGPAALGGCLILLALILVGIALPLPVVLILALFFWGVSLLQKVT